MSNVFYAPLARCLLYAPGRTILPAPRPPIQLDYLPFVVQIFSL